MRKTIATIFRESYTYIFFIGHYLFLDAHFFSFHQFIWVLDFCPWTSLKENVDIDIKYLLLIINNKSKTKTLKKFISYFQFPIPFSHATFPICISHSTFHVFRSPFPLLVTSDLYWKKIEIPLELALASKIRMSDNYDFVIHASRSSPI